MYNFKNILILGITSLFCFACNKSGKIHEKTNTNSTDSINSGLLSDSEIYLAVGTYTNKDSKGIYIYKFDTISGTSQLLSETDIINPSYLTFSNDGNYIYAVSETGDDNAGLSAFAFDKNNGQLKLINKQSTGGADPCYVSISESGEHVVVANYSGSNITVFKTDTTGRLSPASRVINFTGKGVDKKRQAKPHLHCVYFSPDQKYLYAIDLGTDKVHKFEANTYSSFLKVGTPAFFNTPAGNGPRHITFHPNNRFAYLLTELSGDVIAYSYDNKTGNLAEIQIIKADTLNAQASADIHISPDGRFLYASNRLKGDGIAIFSIDQTNGMLTKAGYQETGIHPRNFAITPNGKFLLVANRDTDQIQIFTINKETGLLTDTNQDINISMPVCLKFY